MLEDQLLELQSKLATTEDFMERMEIAGEIEDIQVKLGHKTPPKPVDSSFECFGCGS